MVKYVIIGSGYLGNKFNESLEDAILIANRIKPLDTEEQVLSIVREYCPEVVINAIGKTGRPTVDWCEKNKEATFFSNVTIPAIMAEVCETEKLYMLHIGSGCIFEGDKHSLASGELSGSGWSEDDKPNFKGSWYSKTKIWSEQILSTYNNVLQLRIRMPVDDKPSPRNLITKLLGYKKVLGDEPNSITYIPDLMRVASELMDIKETGIWNVVNKGTICHREILEMYRDIVDPKFEMPEFISIEELNKITIAGRSNCVLSIKKLEDKGIFIKNVKNAMEVALENYATEIC